MLVWPWHLAVFSHNTHINIFSFSSVLPGINVTACYEILNQTVTWTADKEIPFNYNTIGKSRDVLIKLQIELGWKAQILDKSNEQYYLWDFSHGSKFWDIFGAYINKVLRDDW